LIGRHHPTSEDQQSHLIVGVEHARALKFLEGGAIETTISPKGYMVLRSELPGERRVDLKPPLAMPAITYYVRSYPRAICREGLMKKELAPKFDISEVRRKRSRVS
jgi:hypothetical protein